MTIRTAEQLSDAISADLIWRKRELSSLRFLTESAPERSEKRHALIRGLVALLYAHWEGFVKRAAESYLEFVHYQRLRYRDLSVPFLALSIRGRLRSAAASDKIGQHLDIVRFFVHELDGTSILPYKGGVKTRANLSSRVLKEILDTLGLDFAQFATKENLIDEVLLDARNTIAHGEYLKIDYDRYIAIHDQVLGMMEGIRTLVENAAALGQYKVQVGTVRPNRALQHTGGHAART